MCIRDRRTLIASGDVYIRAEKPLQDIPDADVVCYGLWVDPVLATCLLYTSGDKFGVTRERVRQIKEKAIRRLRQSNRSKLLKSYLG